MALDVDEAFDSLLMAEDAFRFDGRRAGEDRGREIGFTEGYHAGVDRGSKIGTEVGFMWGFCCGLEKLLVVDERRQRALRTVRLLLESIKSFPVSDPSCETYVDELEKIRGKFRQLSSLLHIQRSIHDQSLSF